MKVYSALKDDTFQDLQDANRGRESTSDWIPLPFDMVNTVCQRFIFGPKILKIEENS